MRKSERKMRAKPEGGGEGGGEKPGDSKTIAIRRIEYSSKKGEEYAEGNKNGVESKDLA